MDRQMEIENIINKLLLDNISKNDAVELLIYEMGRGGRILVVDENLEVIESELSNMNYTTEVVPRGMNDSGIKKLLNSRVFITRNGKHFANKDDMNKYHYGLIWVVAQITDCNFLARMIKNALMKNNFSKKLVQIVKI